MDIIAENKVRETKEYRRLEEEITAFKRIAWGLVELFKALESQRQEVSYLAALSDRYRLPVAELTGESYLQHMAEVRYQGDRERAARSLLRDYRVGHLGNLPLEWPVHNN